MQTLRHIAGTVTDADALCGKPAQKKQATLPSLALNVSAFFCPLAAVSRYFGIKVTDIWFLESI
jgi:hypothetical protein